MTNRAHLYAAVLALAAACGASAGPVAPDDAPPSDTPREAACGPRETPSGGECIAAADDACGRTRRRCVAPMRCVVDSDYDGGLTEPRCVALP